MRIAPAGALLVVLLATGPTANASDEQRAAQVNREMAVERASARLRSETLPPEEYPPESTDYYALSAQIRRLSALIKDMVAAEDSETDRTILFRGVADGPAWRERVFGPKGPTVESVSALMRYRLVLLGNPNLELGKVQDRGAHIEGRLVTRDGSLIEVYEFDKQSGLIRLQPAT